MQYIANIIDTIRNGRRIQANPKIRQFLATYGDLPISAMTICKKPIQKTLDGVLSILSSTAQGINQSEQSQNWNEVKDSLNYDDLYHLYMVVRINGSPVIIEKNQVLNIGFIDPKKYLNDNGLDGKGLPRCMEVPSEYLTDVFGGVNLSINEMLTNATDQYGADRIYLYRGDSFNCQRFLLDILTASDIIIPTQRTDPGSFQELEKTLNETGYIPTEFRGRIIPRVEFPGIQGYKMETRHEKISNEIYNFIYQDTATLFNNMPSVVRLAAQNTTDFAALLDRVIHGGKQHATSLNAKPSFEADSIEQNLIDVNREHGLEDAELQSIAFKKSDFDTRGARNWMKARGLTPIKRVDTTKNYYRYRITEPNYNNYTTKKIPNINLIFGYNKKTNS